MTYTFTFTTRETYLAYRADWRAKYKVLSQEIRDLKRQMFTTKGLDVSEEQSKLYYLRVRANKMMLELEAAKEFKNAQLAISQQAA